MILEKVIDDIKGEEYTIEYLYDESNMLYGFIYGNKVYYYLKDILGNIIGIVNELGTVVCEYEYDAYGEHKVTNLVGNVGDINPFRYKGYYYDVETNLFLISSRYYSPELCRWISPDDIRYLDPSSVNGLNLYCYCMNNPIMYSDPSGHFPWLIIPVILLVAVFAKGHKTDLKEEDININGTSSGKVKIKITENNIEIESSYRYGHEDMVFILNTIKNHELYKKYNYNRDIESYLAEWKAHNFAYYVMPFGEIGKQTRNVNLDRNEDQDVFKDWYWIFRLF